MKKEHAVSMRIGQNLVDLIDMDRKKTRTPRSSWIAQAIVERLERKGYEIEDDVDDIQEKLPL